MKWKTCNKVTADRSENEKYDKEIPETFLTTARCPKCGRRLYTSDLTGYAFVCKECDENFFPMEIRENAGQFTEIIVPISKKQFRKKRSRYLRLAEEYTCVFFGYNDAEVVCAVFAWEETLSSGMINNFCNDIIATNKN